MKSMSSNEYPVLSALIIINIIIDIKRAISLFVPVLGRINNIMQIIIKGIVHFEIIFLMFYLTSRASKMSVSLFTQYFQFLDF